MYTEERKFLHTLPAHPLGTSDNAVYLEIIFLDTLSQKSRYGELAPPSGLLRAIPTPPGADEEYRQGLETFLN